METLTNKVQLIGHLGKDAEIKTFETGKKMQVSLATDASYTDKEGKRVEVTDWHNLVGWNKVAEIGEKYFKKGKHIAIEGQLKNRSYDDKDGNTRYISEVVVDQFLFLDKKEEN